jgi:hypothetical protein
MKGTRSGQQATVSASARESIAGIWQLQVSDNTTGLKMGESAPGASIIKQTFTLAPGTHQIAVGDISTGTFQGLHAANAFIQAQQILQARLPILSRFQ